ncbi:HNH endonuclease [Ensifer sp. ENS10]|uniref:HNH endonuclease n=1 Tax=Ensifer sp. ENS10 TaxID=2769286 RepID=UPI00177BCD8F|nr:HNH endonuclease [Ensifer sp. ENS10]MBD9511550.1 HNH endonuclease [Ensifer sp. ENS10]
MSKKFPKDAWIKAALRKAYLIVSEDGTIHRANKADAQGNVDRSKGYSIVTQQVQKKSGRVYFNMTFMGHTKSILTNRVVAWRFHPNPLNLPQVNHIDGNKENNAKSNLEWSSGSDNEKHAHRTGLKTGRGSSNSNAKLSADQVVKIRAAANDNTPEQLAEEYGVSRSTIINVLNRKTWKHL